MKKETTDVQDILKPLDIAVETLQAAIDDCRDATIKSTDRNTRSTLAEVQTSRLAVARMEENLQNCMQDIVRRFERVDESIVEVRQILSQSKSRVSKWALQKLNSLQSNTDHIICISPTAHLLDTSSSTENETKQQAVSQWYWLLGILAGSDPQQSPADADDICSDVVQDVHRDLHLILTHATKLTLTSQGQAHSILNYDRFFDWMFQDCSDMLLIEGNIEDTARENVSPMSLFCVNFGLTMMDRDAEDVFLFFFCGLHTGYAADRWAGPNGMLRSLVVQLLISTLQQKCPELDLSSPDYVHRLARLEMSALVNLFENLLDQFDEKATIHCIIDGVSRFDVHARNYAQHMWFIVQRFQSMVCDREGGPRLKVLMTVPFRSSSELRRGVLDEFRLSLCQGNVNPRAITERSFRAAFPIQSMKMAASVPACKEEVADYKDER